MRFHIEHNTFVGKTNYITVDFYPSIKEIIFFSWIDLESALRTSHDRTIGIWKIKKLK